MYGLQLSCKNQVAPTTMAKAYHPIALYNTMGKVITAVVTDVLVFLTVRHSILLSKCFGGFPSRTTVDSLLYLTHNIKNAWQRKKVVTILFLDIASTFPNTMTSHLLLNMRRLGYPMQLINFFDAMLRDHHTRLTFDGYTSELLPIYNGIGQGEPSLMILYLIYSYALVKIPQMESGDGGAYVDDTFFGWHATHSKNMTPGSMPCWTNKMPGQRLTTPKQRPLSSNALDSHNVLM